MLLNSLPERCTSDSLSKIHCLLPEHIKSVLFFELLDLWRVAVQSWAATTGDSYSQITDAKTLWPYSERCKTQFLARKLWPTLQNQRELNQEKGYASHKLTTCSSPLSASQKPQRVEPTWQSGHISHLINVPMLGTWHPAVHTIQPPTGLRNTPVVSGHCTTGQQTTGSQCICGQQLLL